MKYKPIIMGADSVRAILDGKKTMTRRVVKPQPINMPDGAYINPYNHNYEHFTAWTMDNKMLLGCGGNIKNTAHWKCPYGIVGDRLWVKETWTTQHDGIHDDNGFGIYVYKADGEWLDNTEGGNVSRWESPIFMPKEASRITLEITDIRVEKLQSIMEKDAKAEGVISDDEYADRAGEENLFPCPICNGYQVHEALGYNLGITEVDCTACDTEKKRYSIIWDSLNAKRGYPWASNPWVWVVEFKLVEEIS